MKTKILSAAALAVVFAGAAFAGPSYPTTPFSKPVAASRGCPMLKATTALAATGSPKTHAYAQTTTGYRHKGCFVAANGKAACKPTGASCAAMAHS